MAVQDVPPNNLPTADYLKEHLALPSVPFAKKIHGWIFCEEKERSGSSGRERP